MQETHLNQKKNICWIIYTYKDMYEEAGNDLTCANFAHVDGNEEND